MSPLQPAPPRVSHLLPCSQVRGGGGGRPSLGREEGASAQSWPGWGDTTPVCERGVICKQRRDGGECAPQGHAGHSPGNRARSGVWDLNTTEQTPPFLLMELALILVPGLYKVTLPNRSFL